MLLKGFVDQVSIGFLDRGVKDVLLDRHVSGEAVGQLLQEGGRVRAASFEFLEQRYHLAVLSL